MSSDWEDPGFMAAVDQDIAIINDGLNRVLAHLRGIGDGLTPEILAAIVAQKFLKEFDEDPLNIAAYAGVAIVRLSKAAEPC